MKILFAKNTSRISGIYCITNILNNKTYIGSSTNIKRRECVHFLNLKKNIHPNRPLQNSYNKYGVNKFRFDILEICTKDNLLIRESYWIDTKKSYNRRFGFNILRTPDNKMGENASFYGKKHSAETITKMKKSHTKLWESKERRNRHSEILKKKFNDKNIRAELSKRMKATWKNNDKLRKDSSERMRIRNILMWQDPIYREKMSLMSRTRPR